VTFGLEPGRDPDELGQFGEHLRFPGDRPVDPLDAGGLSACRPQGHRSLAGAVTSAHALRDACLARQPGKCGMALCPNFVKAQGGPAQLACAGRNRVEFLSEMLKRQDWHCPLDKF
jgi:hypothetical protein